MLPITRRTFLNGAALVAASSALHLTALDSGSSQEDNSTRRRNFDLGWKFQLGDPDGAQTSHFDDSAWRPLTLPHDWSIEGEFSKDAPSQHHGGYLPTGIGWYRKAFILPHDSRGKRVVLEFDGVYQRSEVWINNSSLGMRPSGFISFAHDLTPHLAPAGEPNVIAVRVDNSLQPNCRWYSGSGIYRHTWLTITGPLHIAQWGVFVHTPSVTAKISTIQVSTRIQNEGTEPVEFDLLTEILDEGGAVVEQGRVSHKLEGDSEGAVSSTLNHANPMLWSPRSPYIYGLRSTLLVHGIAVDQDTTTFGVRDVNFDVDRGLLINGQHFKMNGVCIHGDGGSVGAAVPERVWERRLELLQEMGCNAIRLSHNPVTPELLKLLDRKGFMVMAEAFDEWKQPKAETPLYGYHKYFDEWSERDLTSMIQRDRNHPSIVIWSAGNEVPDQGDPQGPATLRRLKEIIHRHDPTRLITVACDGIAADLNPALPEFLGELDVVGYNYVDRWRDRREKYYSVYRHQYPDRRFIGTESVAPIGERGVYNVDQRDRLWFERASNAQIEVEQLQKFIQTYDYVSGDFIWTGIDYLGEALWPNVVAGTGPLDTCGFKKDNYYFYQSLWSDRPVLHLAPHWNWEEQEHRIVSVSCFTNCESVELFLNGESLGVKGFEFPRPGYTEVYGHYPPRGEVIQTTADLHLQWDVPYKPGTLMAKGTRGGKTITTELSTTGRPAKLQLTADRSRIRTGRDDVAHIIVSVLDADGRTVPTADDQITFTLTGKGSVIGVDNGRLESHESYKGMKRAAFNGLALVLLQSNGMPGSMRLLAESGSLSPAEIVITAD